MVQVSKFFGQTQIQTIKYGLNDTKRIKNKQVTLILYSFTPWYDFSRDFDAQSNFGKKFTHLEHSYLKYALVKHLLVNINYQ